MFSRVDLGKINICGVLYIWYICRHLNKCCVVKLNWPNLGIGVLVEMSCFVWKHFLFIWLLIFFLLYNLHNIFWKSADRIMCVTPLIKIRPCRQIQINGYCYYQRFRSISLQHRTQDSGLWVGQKWKKKIKYTFSRPLNSVSFNRYFNKSKMMKYSDRSK